MKMRKTLAAAVVLAALAVGWAAPASAATTESLEEVTFSQEVRDHAANATSFTVESVKPATVSRAAAARGFQASSVQPNTRMPQVVASCRNPGGTCSLSRSVQTSATISGGGGVSFGVVNANLGGSYSQSLTLGVSCNSPTLGQGQVYNAYVQGTFVIFTYNGASGTAFLPTGIDCRVQRG
ncbi:hypothetical protein [uncultured Microbacterium sp.]|uniref:hypothetical protein n=1 Tax=uncultured Microbacterium sp. TaxID=191216 RepID=UPI0025CE5DE4|nr:hypothetical protein [uncultured Microbacterium sp.]